jgi:hypothetical protein
MREVGWGVLLVVWSPLHGVVDFPCLQLRRRLIGVLVHFPFGADVDGAIFGFVVNFIAMVHAVQGSWCIRPWLCPWSRFEAPPRWLHCGALCSKVPASVCCGGPL